MLSITVGLFCLTTIMGPSEECQEVTLPAPAQEEVVEETDKVGDMGYKQLEAPTVPYNVYFGECLRQVRSAFGAPAVHARASQAGDAAVYKHYDRNFPTNVSVPVYFTHWGTYSGVTGEFGHVVIHVPGKGFMSSPSNVHAYGVTWYSSIAEIERIVGGKYRFWTEDVNGVRVVEPTTPSKPKTPNPQTQDNSLEQELEEVKAIYYKNGKMYQVAVFNSFSGYWSEYSTDDWKYNREVGYLTGKIVPVTKAHFNVMKQDMAQIRKGK